MNIFLLILGIVLLVVLLGVVRSQIVPMLDSLKKTVDTVEGTTVYISRSTVSPLVRIASLAVAASKFVQVLTGRGGRKGAKK